MHKNIQLNIVLEICLSGRALAGHPHRLRHSLILRSVMVMPYFSSTSWHTAARVQSIKLNFIWSGDLSISILRISFSCAGVSWRFSPNLRPRFFSLRHAAPSFLYALDILLTACGEMATVSAISDCFLPFL
nr:hypothetical protein [Petralouisia muris]